MDRFDVSRLHVFTSSRYEVAEFVKDTAHVINPNPPEREVLQTASKFVEAGSLKIALFRLKWLRGA